MVMGLLRPRKCTRRLRVGDFRVRLYYRTSTLYAQRIKFVTNSRGESCFKWCALLVHVKNVFMALSTLAGSHIAGCCSGAILGATFGSHMAGCCSGAILGAISGAIFGSYTWES